MKTNKKFKITIIVLSVVCALLLSGVIVLLCILFDDPYLPIEKDEFLRDMNNIIEVMDMVKTVDKDTKPLRQNAVSFSSLREDLVYINDDFEKIENSDLSIPKII